MSDLSCPLCGGSAATAGYNHRFGCPATLTTKTYYYCPQCMANLNTEHHKPWCGKPLGYVINPRVAEKADR